MKTRFLRAAALTAALALICGSVFSCGKDEKTNEPKTADKLLENSYRSVPVDMPEEIDRIYSMTSIEGTDEVFISAYNYEKGESLFYKTNLDFEEFTKLEYDLGIEDYDELNLSAVPAPDGNIYAVATINDYGDFELPDYSDPDFDYESFDYEAMEAARETSYMVFTMDLEGNVLTSAEIEDVDKYAQSEYSIWINNFTPYSSDKLILGFSGNEECYVTMDSSGSINGKLEDIHMQWVNSCTFTAENELVFMGYGDDGQEFVFLDPETLKKSDREMEIDRNDNFFWSVNSLITGSGDYSLYLSSDKGLYGLKPDNSYEEIINWSDSDLNHGNVSGMVALENGDFVAYINDYSTGDSGLFRLTRRDVSELSDTQVITIGMLYDDWNVSRKVTEFNKQSDKYRIKLVDYSEYDVYDAESESYTNTSAQQLKLDIVSGNAPDMIATYDFSLISSLASKGLYADLYEFLENDPDLSKDDILPNVLEASEIDGKLYGLSPSFSVDMLACKSKYFKGDSWNLDDIKELYASLPDDMALLQYFSSNTNVFFSLYDPASFIDIKSGKCSFDSPGFIDLLEFCNQFPDNEDVEPDWENTPQEEINLYFENIQTSLRNDKALIEQIYISDFTSYARTIQSDFGDDVTLISKPSDTLCSPYMNLNSAFAILSSSGSKDVCWDFIKTFFSSDNYEGDNGRYILPTITKYFEAAADRATEKPYFVDPDTGEKTEYQEYYSIGKESFPLQPLTAEERDELVALIKSVNRIDPTYAVSSDVSDILNEEVPAYFKGERTAQETADIIQNRISIIISEQA